MIPRTYHDLREITDHRLPLSLADLHRGRETGVRLDVKLHVQPDRASDIVRGAGFSTDAITVEPTADECSITATRQWELPDHVGAGMRLLLVGLNPSPAASDRGVGFARPGNRFWPALLASGLASVDRDPRHLLVHHHVGMTDLVKRTTARAAELEDHEYVSGIDRLERLAGWLQPGAVCFVGLQGWRAAIDKRAKPGPQTRAIGACATYVMPNPSGLNANHQLPDFIWHFRAVADLAN